MFTDLYHIKDIIANIFNCDKSHILNIEPQKHGMTNDSYLFEYNNDKYLLRIPGDGSNNLVNRRQEYDVYQKIKNLDISDHVVYINPENGVKISKYIENCHNCSIDSDSDVHLAIAKLKKLHESNLTIEHNFDIFEKINYYEKLRNKKSKYKDYFQVKSKIFSFQKYLKDNSKPPVLCHIDSVCDNFLIQNENVMLIDWEYAAMHDPDIDIAMFCIYSQLNKDDCDKIIDIYYSGNCDIKTRTNIYCYIASCGLLWSNWCEYKEEFGIELGDYAISQYEYAETFYKYALNLIPPKYKIRIDNAIIMAAGTSSRFAPISYEIPKALIKVKNEVLIERLIKQLLSADIEDIIIVTGYMSEKFEYLKDKFNVKLVNNPDYLVKNNYSSLHAAKDHLRNSIICSADNYYTTNVFSKVELQPYYSATYASGKTDEWCISHDENNLITDVTVGGRDSWIMIGHALFDENFSKYLLNYIECIYDNPSYNSLLWEYLYIYNINNLDLYIKTFDDNIIFEFDSLDELRKFDHKYNFDSGSKILSNLKNKHNCEESDIININTIKNITNESIGFSYQVYGDTYTYLYNSEEK